MGWFGRNAVDLLELGVIGILSMVALRRRKLVRKVRLEMEHPELRPPCGACGATLEQVAQATAVLMNNAKSLEQRIAELRGRTDWDESLKRLTLP